MQPEEHIGWVESYDARDGHVRLQVEEGSLARGDILHFQGPERNFEEAIATLRRHEQPVRAVEAQGDAEVRVRHPVEEGTEVRRVHYPYQDDQAELMRRFFDRASA